ncbi:DUF11 domain-containing protein [Calycomorphotria hydatis]|uniref:Large cysteine-rich periplasmic protein OmcB n=1 Tax=Calycomorphotria hydatis TaxID=2528027 RepID=A0A517T9R0_9PLAN|nr:DUF11 domain-containing protein [Calycomorphotria hydatis]QDT65114.1 Large cysteine-rich periplasmic protein OmcB precursor [Calycomorphotria hydatis]
MGHAVWKLSAVTVVVVAGGAILLFAQEGLHATKLAEAAKYHAVTDSESGETPAAFASVEDAPTTNDALDTEQSEPIADTSSQWEFDFGSSPLADVVNQSEQKSSTVAASPAPQQNSEIQQVQFESFAEVEEDSATTVDPFAEFEPVAVEETSPSEFPTQEFEPAPEFGDDFTAEPISENAQPATPIESFPDQFEPIEEPATAEEIQLTGGEASKPGMEPPTTPLFFPRGGSVQPAPAPAPEFEVTGQPEPALAEFDEATQPRLLPASEEELQGVGTVGDVSPEGPQTPSIKITKHAPEKAILGKPYVYQIHVENIGKVPAYQVVVEDLIPRGSKLTGTIPQAELDGKTLIWHMGTVPAGESQTIKVRIVPTDAGKIGSIATVSFASEVSARTVIVAPELSLKLVAQEQVELGNSSQFQFTMRNDGNGDATNVILRDLLPEGFKHNDGNDLEYEVGTLKAGEERTVKLTVSTVRPGKFVNRAVITADGNLTAEAKVVVDVLPPQLQITRRGPKTRFVGQPTKFTNEIINESRQAISNVNVVEQLPPGMEFVKASHEGQYNSTNHQVTWPLAQVGQGTTPLELWVRPIGVGDQASVVSVAGNDGQRAQLNSTTMVRGYPMLESKTNRDSQAVLAGERFSLSLTVTNTGSAAAESVKVNIVPSRELSLLETDGNFEAVPGQQAFVVHLPQPLQPGQTAQLQVILEGVTAGDGRVRFEIESSSLQRPLVAEEAVRVLDDAS